MLEILEEDGVPGLFRGWGAAVGATGVSQVGARTPRRARTSLEPGPTVKMMNWIGLVRQRLLALHQDPRPG